MLLISSHVLAHQLSSCFVLAQPVEAAVAQLSLQQGAPAGQPPAAAAAEGRPITKEEQGQFMRRKAAEKAAEMRRQEVSMWLKNQQ